VVTRRAELNLASKAARLHIVEGFLLAVDSLSEVVNAIRSAEDGKAAKKELVSRWELSEAQADAVLNLSLRRITGLAIAELREEDKELRKGIQKLETLLADRVRGSVIGAALRSGDHIGHFSYSSSSSSSSSHSSSLFPLLVFLDFIMPRSFAFRHTGQQGVMQVQNGAWLSCWCDMKERR
jgi:hypothetical protein